MMLCLDCKEREQCQQKFSKAWSAAHGSTMWGCRFLLAELAKGEASQREEPVAALSTDFSMEATLKNHGMNDLGEMWSLIGVPENEAGLSKMERGVFRLVQQGKNRDEICEQMGISHAYLRQIIFRLKGKSVTLFT